MNVCIFYYDGFCEFEVAITAANFNKQNLFAAALENRVYVSDEKQRYLPDRIIAELDPKDIDLFVIPGGDPSALYENQVLRSFITDLNKMGKNIAGICGGTYLMARYGILDNKRCTGAGSGLKPDMPDIALFEKSLITDESIIVDGNVITAAGQAYVELAIELGKLMKIYKDEEEIVTDFNWLKNIRG
jgi:4-methyl-5(b-hydroxyethyl)-thiazole monophosphate biosynthesis